jgi:hypothetical protein
MKNSVAYSWITGAARGSLLVATGLRAGHQKGRQGRRPPPKNKQTLTLEATPSFGNGLLSFATWTMPQSVKVFGHRYIPLLNKKMVYSSYSQVDLS